MPIDVVLLIIEIIGIVSFSISGSLVAIDKEMDFFGVILLAILTSFGGGITRDLILGINPPLFFNELLHLVAVCAATSVTVFVLASIFKCWYIKKEELVIRINNYIDALGLGAFAVSGVKICLTVCPEGGAFLAVCMGLVSAIGGGMIRDVCLGTIPFVFKKRIYALAALGGAIVYYLIYVVIFDGGTAGDIFGSIFGVVLVFFIRVLATTFKWNMPKAIKFDEVDKW